MATLTARALMMAGSHSRQAKAPNLARCHVVPPRLVSIVVIQHREHRLASLPTAQREEEVGTFADLSLDAHGAAMHFDQPARDGY